MRRRRVHALRQRFHTQPPVPRARARAQSASPRTPAPSPLGGSHPPWAGGFSLCESFSTVNLLCTSRTDSLLSSPMRSLRSLCAPSLHTSLPRSHPRHPFHLSYLSLIASRDTTPRRARRDQGLCLCPSSAVHWRCFLRCALTSSRTPPAPPSLSP